jgi:ABC-type nitrate/sulfonate/bicarbonate transport system substrate-binding protein
MLPVIKVGQGFDGAGKAGMGRHIFDAMAGMPHLPAIAQRLDVIGSGSNGHEGDLQPCWCSPTYNRICFQGATAHDGRSHDFQLTDLQNLFRDLFQLELADLDFGIYRLLRLKREEIEAFLTVGVQSARLLNLCYALFRRCGGMVALFLAVSTSMGGSYNVGRGGFGSFEDKIPEELEMKRFILVIVWALASGALSFSGTQAFGLDKVNVTLPSKSFQFIIFPLAKERGYMKEEGIDLNVVVMASTTGLQAVIAGEMDFTGSGSSALVAITKGNAPLKTVLAVNDQVLQWLMVRPQFNSFKDLKNKKVAVTGVAAVATFMLKRLAPKYGLDANKELTFLALPPGQRLGALVSGAVDAGLLSSEERFAALDQGMKEILYLGKEVKNSWGTVATNDQFIKEKPKLMHGFMRALLKSLRLVKQNREVAIDAMIKFSELNRELAARTYDGMIGTFTSNGVVDEETQKNDLDIVREVLKVDKVVPVDRAYDFSFAKRADEELTKAGWRP